MTGSQAESASAAAWYDLLDCSRVESFPVDRLCIERAMASLESAL